MDIRTMTLDDIHSILDIQRLCYPSDLLEDKETFVSILSQSNLCYVMTLNSIVIGYLFAHPWDDPRTPPTLHKFDIERIDPTCGVVYIHDLCIHPEFSRKGLGSILYRQLEQNLTPSHMTTLVAINGSATSFWKKHGYVLQDCAKDILTSYTDPTASYMVKH